MVGDPSAITATARSQENPMLLILQTGSAAGAGTLQPVRCMLLGGSTVHCEIPKFPPLPFAWLLAVGAGPRSRVRACTWR